VLYQNQTFGIRILSPSLSFSCDTSVLKNRSSHFDLDSDSDRAYRFNSRTMKMSPLALLVFLIDSFDSSNQVQVKAFSPAPFNQIRSIRSIRSEFGWQSLAMSNFLGMDDEDDDDEDDEDDEDDYLDIPTESIKLPFTGLKLDPDDTSQLSKPIPSAYYPQEYMKESNALDSELVQTMSKSERAENLEAMRQIRKSDLPDLKEKRDHAGYTEATQDLRDRIKSDPWYGVNDRIRNALQLGESEEVVTALQELAEKLGGPPGDVIIGPKGFAEQIEIYKYEPTAKSQEIRIAYEVRKQRAAHGKVLKAELQRNLEKQRLQYEEDLRFPGRRQSREAKVRRENTMGRLMGELEEDRKKLLEKAKDMLGKVPDSNPSISNLLDVARLELIKKYSGNSQSLDESDDDESDSKTSSDSKKGASEAATTDSSGRPRLPGDKDVILGELGAMELESGSTTTTGPLTVEVSSAYNKDQSDPPMRKHCFQYTIRITNNSEDKIQLIGRRFEIQTVGSSMKDVVQGEGVTGRQPILKPGEVFEYTSTAPLSVRPVGTTIIAARMSGEYRYIALAPGQDMATEEQIEASDDVSAKLGMFHFIFPEDQRVIPFLRTQDEDDEEEDEEDEEKTPASKQSKPTKSPTESAPGDDDMSTGDIAVPLNEESDTVTESIRVQVSSAYRPERSDAALEKHCFAYSIRITNESPNSIQLISRRFEIQTIGKDRKDVVQGPGVTGRQPILKAGESFEYTSTAPLSVRPMLDKTPVIARMQGAYNVVVLGDDGTTPISSTPIKARLGTFHFILPALDMV